MADPNERKPSPTLEEQVRRLYGGAETRTARAMEQLVAGEAFGELLTRVTENVVAVTKLSSDVGDLVLRNLRVAGRSDITRLARQLNRTEDKLELLLQRVEELGDAIERRDAAGRDEAPASSGDERSEAGPGGNGTAAKPSSPRARTRKP